MKFILTDTCVVFIGFASVKPHFSYFSDLHFKEFTVVFDDNS